jgi:hypothetical protein
MIQSGWHTLKKLTGLPEFVISTDQAQRGKRRNQREAIHSAVFHANRSALIPPFRGKKMPLISG